MADELYDAVVVGAGAAGGWVAKELCEAGARVLLLDAGPDVEPARDFPLPAPPEQRLAARVVGLRRQPVQIRCAAYNARTRRFFVDDRDNPYSMPRDRPFNWFRGRQVGGRLHVWARVVPRLTERELERWPISLGELEPAYERVEDFLGVEEVQPNAAEERFVAAVARTPVSPPRVARHELERRPATIRAAERTGLLTLRPDAVVRAVTLERGNATGVAYVDRTTRREESARGRAVVLCASAFETLRIMLNSGVGDSSGLLGRGVMDHVLTGIGGPVPAPLSEDDDADPYDAGRVTGFQVPRFREVGGAGWGFQGAIGRGAPAWYLLAHGEMLARPENRVALDPRRRDAWDMPLAHVSCAPGPNELAMAADQLTTMRELAAAGGLAVRTPPSGRRLEGLAFRLWRRRLLGRSGAFLPGTAAHEVGGAPLGTDPRESVLSPTGQCWDAENLFVADGAAFPAGCWQNVTLTIMALAVRTAEHVARHVSAR